MFMRVSHLQKKAAQEIIATTLHSIANNEKTAAQSWADLAESISQPAADFANQICNINTEKYGIQRPPVEPVEPDNVMVVSSQTYQTRDGIHPIPNRLVPTQTMGAFVELNKAMKNDIDREVVIQSGYRSPAYQLFVFLFQLRENNWSIEKTLKKAALPGRSQHASKKQALDLRAKQFIGTHDSYDFSRTAEFRWLKERAAEFGFSLSYPQNNSTNTQFEPWHWRHSHTAS